MDRRILLFIPMYNCEKQIIRVLDQLTDDICKYLSEVIIINNCSTDNGEEAVKEYLYSHDIPVRVCLFRNHENYGLGGSHKVAFNYALDNEFKYIVVLHGDDQGRISDFLSVIKSKAINKYDCVLGARFMRDSQLIGYSKYRILGNYGFNMLFSIVSGKVVWDLGSGLNMYKVQSLETRYYLKYPDTLYFNDLMLLASFYRHQKICFYPISWREEDQISNNKLLSFSAALLKMILNYVIRRKEYMESEMRERIIDDYQADLIFSNDRGTSI